MATDVFMKNWLKFGLLAAAFVVLLVLLATLLPLSQKNQPVTFLQADRKILTLNCEVAKTDTARRIGLMYRDYLPEDQCLLFVFDDVKQHGMWMKNMKFSIDIIFLDKDKRITQMHENVPVCDFLPCPTYPSGEPSLYAIEMPHGLISEFKLTNEIRVSF